MNKHVHGQLGNCSSKHTAAIQVGGSFDTLRQNCLKITRLHKSAQAGGLIICLRISGVSGRRFGVINFQEGTNKERLKKKLKYCGILVTPCSLLQS